MAKYLINVVETYRVDGEDEAARLIEEAKERDHKILGPQLDLFFMDSTAPGMPYWLPKGWKLEEKS